MSEDDEVENQYRLALGDELPRIRGKVLLCEIAFDGVQTALENGAWDSSAADVFSSELSTHRANAATAGDDCGQAFQARYDNEPEMVPDDDPKARWSPPSSYPGGSGPTM